MERAFIADELNPSRESCRKEPQYRKKINPEKFKRDYEIEIRRVSNAQAMNRAFKWHNQVYPKVEREDFLC